MTRDGKVEKGGRRAQQEEKEEREQIKAKTRK